jgi:ribonuclease T2
LSEINFRFVLSRQADAPMSRRRWFRLKHFVVAALSFTLIFATALAQERRQGVPGQFDYYVLALSWSPSYCEARQDRAPERMPDRQCGGRPYSFVVHGLWPQYERGFPSYCVVPPPRLNRSIVDRMLDLMPSPRLVFHEWDQHGTCSGLSPRAYFENVRKARERINIPPEYVELDRAIEVTTAEVTDAFVRANPGLSRSTLSISCDRKWLTEVRICLGRDLTFRDCTNMRRNACHVGKARMPAVRGG